MKIKIKVEKEIDVTTVRIGIPIRHGNENMPADFPLRVGDAWAAFVGVDDGIIRGWPKGKAAKATNIKVCDSGLYTLYDYDGLQVADRHDYVPHGLIPGEFGDYIHLDVDAEGRIKDWPTNPDLSEFFQDEEE